MPTIRFKPGIVSDLTANSVQNGWVDGNLIRFRNGFPESMGGWTRLAESAGTVPGVTRALHEWSSNSGSNRLAIGSNLKVFVLQGDSLYDITPLRPAINLPNNPIYTTGDPATLGVAVPFNQCVVGDLITFSGATTACGSYTVSDLNSTFTVAALVGLNALLLTAAHDPGTVGQFGGGASVVATPELQIGPVDASVAIGFGVGPYSAGTFGTPRTPLVDTFSQVVTQPRLWYLDNFGEDLVLNPRGGGLYVWHSSGGFGNRASLISDDSRSDSVPKYSNGAFISIFDQSLVALGCTPFGGIDPDPMQIRWSASQNIYDWFPNSANTAGGQRLAHGSFIVGYRPMAHEILIWTDKTLYSMQYIGAPFIYGFTPVANDLSMIGPNASATDGSSTWWMDNGCFRIYNGSVAELPCPVKAKVFSDINYLQAWKIQAGTIKAFSEAMWLYPSKNSIEIDSYVKYNYRDNVWDVGRLARTSWSDSGRLQSPIGIDPDGKLYFQESGVDADGNYLPFEIESGDMSIQDGEYYSLLKRIIPDTTFTGTSAYQGIKMDVRVRETSNQPVRLVKTFNLPESLNNDGYIDGRARGRRLSVRLYNQSVGTAFRMGSFQADIAANGKR